MMRMLSSGPALALVSAAALSLTASPAMARGWHRERGIDGGDILAGVLILGGIAAVASAASNSSRSRDARDYRYPDARYPNARYPEAGDYRDYREDDGRYGAPRAEDNYPGGPTARDGGSIDDVVNVCTNEIERGGRQIDSVEGVNRASDGWRVDGRLSDGRAFSCTAGQDGSIRSATVDGRALI